MSETCPGKYKCHGCMQWCDVCGDVDQICDDPHCDTHKRWNEIEQEYASASARLSQAKTEMKYLEKEFAEAHEALYILNSRDRCVVPREFIDHEFDTHTTNFYFRCRKCGQYWDKREPFSGSKLNPCHLAIVDSVQNS